MHMCIIILLGMILNKNDSGRIMVNMKEVNYGEICMLSLRLCI